MTAGNIIPCARAFTDDELSADLSKARTILDEYKQAKVLPEGAHADETFELLVRYSPEDYSQLSPNRRSDEARYSNLESIVEDIESGQMARTMRTDAPAWAVKSYWASGYYFEDGEDEHYHHESEWLRVPTEYGQITTWAYRVDTITADGVATEGEVMLYIGGAPADAEIPIGRISGLLRQLRRLGVEDDG
ncbi:hypothetical protein [Curtobacterium flaccumfaciens]|uniref:hypothetical protein n=1 Tax=Curtobacterium flaccumfaciens TaxID=2035 RepID=UPI001ADB8A64|nr:hypothetical protein [Curtobacterium flaccumfaciens]MBO9043490.1 hypothetical protein [Curtobacterium flaccumfaciens pv. flaccumfaciens]